VDAETLRRWMLEAGLWSRDRKRKAYRQQRTRRRHFGELVQRDGSFEAWLEDRAERACLIILVDGATSRGLGRLDQEVRPGSKVGIRIRRNGRMELLHDGRLLKWRECEKPPVLLERIRAAHDGQGSQPLDERAGISRQNYFEVRAGFFGAIGQNIDGGNIAPVLRNHAGQLMQHAGGTDGVDHQLDRLVFHVFLGSVTK
jgi:hypothetical protein